MVTDITPEGSEAAINGLFYKVSDNDYIKLDEFDSSGPDDYKFEKQNYFSENKLYITKYVVRKCFLLDFKRFL